MSRELVKQVAATMFAERGYHATTLRTLAREADMTLGTLYHYFPSKEELLQELIDDAMAPLMESIGRAKTHGAEDPEGTLRWMVERFILGTLERLGTATISDTELRSLEGDALQNAIRKRDNYQRAMESVVKHGRRQGIFEVRNVKVAVFAILSMCNGIFRWYDPDGRLRPEELAELHVDLTLQLVGFNGGTGKSSATPKKTRAGN